ncbi:MAG: sulfotransferase [Chloroflexi bacterium]|nr:sulfotransferase [Chloroflexota bacterium]
MVDTQTLRREITEILAERDRLFPVRDPQNTAAMKSGLAAYAAALETRRKPGWRPDAVRVGQARAFLPHPIFICGEMKSGTTLLVQLLDGHPNLVVMPGDSHLLADSHKGHTPAPGQEAEWRAYWLHRIVNPTGQHPFWLLGDKDAPYIDFLNYLGYWLGELPPGPRAGFLAAMAAYYCANPTPPAAPRAWVEKTPGNELRLAAALEMNPEGRFVHILRDGRENLASLKTLYQHRGWAWNGRAAIQGLARSLRLALAHQARLGAARYHVLRYEDLLKDPEDEMRKVARQLDLPFDGTLLRPTQNASPAHANSMYAEDQAMGEVLSTRQSRWQATLDSAEQDALLALYYPAAQAAGYRWPVPSRRRWQAIWRTWLRKLTRLASVARLTLEKTTHGD